MTPRTPKADKAGGSLATVPPVGAVDQDGFWLSRSDENHLRRLVAWIRCDVGQSPEELVETVRSITDKIGEPNDDGKARLVQAHREASAVPQYIRAGVKALEKTLTAAERSRGR